jgi:hypothetical protein
VARFTFAWKPRFSFHHSTFQFPGSLRHRRQLLVSLNSCKVSSFHLVDRNPQPTLLHFTMNAINNNDLTNTIVRAFNHDAELAAAELYVAVAILVRGRCASPYHPLGWTLTARPQPSRRSARQRLASTASPSSLPPRTRSPRPTPFPATSSTRPTRLALPCCRPSATR